MTVARTRPHVIQAKARGFASQKNQKAAQEARRRKTVLA